MSFKEKARELVAQMTIEEKASLMSGLNFWYLKSIERLGIPSIMVTDGPHGLRKQAQNADHLGINQSVPAVCFPTSAATACSYDRELLREIGVAIGEECRQEEVAVILGPGVNIKRSPLCGRNFEYFSEDPYVSGELATPLVEGVQSQNVGVSVKHYAFNNQETRRLTTDSVLDERAAREIYLPAFEKIVKDSDPWTFMCSYNLFEEIYCSEHKRLLIDILRDEWGFKGLVMSDWGAVSDRPKGVAAGLDLQMPADNGVNDSKVVESVKNGSITEADLDTAAINVVELILKAQTREPMKYDVDAHRKLAARAAAESTVLLKNDDNVMPMPEGSKFAVIGSFAKTPRHQGAGSSKIEPVKLDDLCECLKDAGAVFDYADGYAIDSDIPDDALIAEAVKTAGDKDYLFVIAGLPAPYESEGFDRKNMKMPESHNKLIEKLTETGKKVVVFLLGGSPMELTWQDKVNGILMCYLGGETVGKAMADLIMNKQAPSGKLTETWPFTSDENPSAKYFPGYQKSVEYRESIFVGYRYYDTADKKVRFPFGYGLSYTTFEYGEPVADKTSMDDTETLTVTVDIKNTGNAPGSEIVQLYVAHKNPTIYKAVHELKGFEKVSLTPGESKTVSFTLDKRSFAYYNIKISDWHVETGEYELQIGASSRDIRGSVTVNVNSTVEAEIPDYRKTAPMYYDVKGGINNVPDEQFLAVLGRPLSKRERAKNELFTEDSTFGDIQVKWIGRVFTKRVKREAMNALGNSVEDVKTMLDRMFTDMPLRSMRMMAGDKMPPQLVDGLLTALNGHLIKGIRMMGQR
ncbi:MAG: glycoside hydrolase family 3 C-terminal domain-containing protein [Oscillospiraceae bacterium]|nr:glycoside hydrolase family 3 C-terminal domain-containing protein [Oscillospiraceae bacterium]